MSPTDPVRLADTPDDPLASMLRDAQHDLPAPTVVRSLGSQAARGAAAAMIPRWGASVAIAKWKLVGGALLSLVVLGGGGVMASRALQQPSRAAAANVATVPSQGGAPREASRVAPPSAPVAAVIPAVEAPVAAPSSTLQTQPAVSMRDDAPATTRAIPRGASGAHARAQQDSPPRVVTSAEPLPAAPTETPPAPPAAPTMLGVPTIAQPSQPATPDPHEEVTLLARARRMLNSNPAGALSLVDEHQQRFADGALGEEREALAIDALVRLRRVGEARTRGERFLREHPGSIHRSSVQTLLEQTQSASH